MTSPPEKPGEPPRGFTINDRRQEFEEPAEAVPHTLPPDGPTVAGDTGKPSGASTSSAGGKAPGAGRAATTRPPHSASEPPLPPVEFATFVLSLGSSALMHLGEVERPGTGKVEKNLPMAKHSIDILSMLEGKTRGNLDTAEAQLLENLLFDLRLRYVEATRK